MLPIRDCFLSFLCGIDASSLRIPLTFFCVNFIYCFGNPYVSFLNGQRHLKLVLKASENFDKNQVAAYRFLVRYIKSSA